MYTKSTIVNLLYTKFTIPEHTQLVSRNKYF